MIKSLCRQPNSNHIMYVKVTIPVARVLVSKDIFESLGEDGVQAILNYYDEVFTYAGEFPLFEQSDLKDWTRYETVMEAASHKNLKYDECLMATRNLYEGPYWNDMSEEEKEEAVADYMRERLIENYECLILDSGAVVII